MPLCKSKSTAILFTVNTVLLLLGIAIMAAAAAAMSDSAKIEEKFPDYKDVVPAAYTNMALAGGVLLIIVGIVGLVGACKYESCCGKIFLMAYIAFLLLLFVLEIAAVGLLFSLAGKLTGAIDNPKAAAAADSFEEKANKLIDSTYAKCCPDGKAAPDEPGCNLFESFLSDTTCATEDDFRAKILDLFRGRVKVTAAVALVVAILQFITLIASCCLLFRGKDEETSEA